HCRISCPRGRLWLTRQLPTRSAVSRPWPLRERSTPALTVKGAPLLAVRIPVSCQPPRAVVRALPPCGDGNIHTEETARMCVRSVGIRPLSRFQLFGSRAPREPSPWDEVCPTSLEKVYA